MTSMPQFLEDVRAIENLLKEAQMEQKGELNVDHPSHYNTGKIEVIDFIEDQNLDFSLGSAVKYICRAGHKGNDVEDLKKAQWYIEREITRRNGTLVTKTQKSFGSKPLTKVKGVPNPCLGEENDV